MSKIHQKYVNVGGPRTTIQFFKNYPYWTHADLESIEFASGDEWNKYVKSFPSTLEYLKLTNIKVPHEPNKRVSCNAPSVPLMALRELHFYEDPDEIRMFVRGTGYRYAPYSALLALGDMPELRKLFLCCKKDYVLAECMSWNTTIPDYFKARNFSGQKFNNLEILAVGYERLSAEEFKLFPAGVKELYLFGYEDSALILDIWNSMSNKGLETISINFLNRSECYDCDNIVEGVFEYKLPIQSHENLKQLILCCDKVKMPLMWYRNFFRAQAQSKLTLLKIKWLRKDVLKSAVKMLPNLQEIHYEKFYDHLESDDDEDEDLYANDESESGDEFEEIKDLQSYYELIKKSHKNINKNVQMFRRPIRNQFAFQK